VEYPSNLIDILQSMDLISPVEHLLKSGQIFIREDGRISTRSSTMSWKCDTSERAYPWVHFYGGRTTGRNCHLWSRILFNCFKVIPRFCRESCYKIVSRPRTFQELLEVCAWAREHGETLPGKCGIELRDFVPHLYGSYHYANSREECEERFAEVRENIRRISRDIPVFWKRSCSEFEMHQGPPDQWPAMTDRERFLEDLMTDVFDLPVGEDQQPEWLIAHVQLGWAKWAHSHGDHSVRRYNGGKPLVRELRIYGE
jgi:hypothetical protein